MYNFAKAIWRKFFLKNIYIIGAGQLGSRHLQALKSVNELLNITVVDPNPECLKTAQERYETYPVAIAQHNVSYAIELPQTEENIDIAIIPTNSNVRKQVIVNLLNKHEVRYVVLEKLLFDNHQDYQLITDLFEKKGVKAWVNCSMRMMPFYQNIKSEITDKKIFYHVSGSQFGLVTNAIHYIDHMAYLTDCDEYSLDTSLLDIAPISSKRKGFLELNGTLSVKFSNGSHGIFTCYPTGSTPIQVQIINSDFRAISKENEGKVWVASKKSDWTWREVEFKIPFQSQMTTSVVEELLNSGRCSLAPYAESAKIHLQLLNPLLHFVNKSGLEYELYPFT